MTRKSGKNSEADVLAKIMQDRTLRRYLASRSHASFLAMYLPEYLKYKTAPFQQEIIRLTEDKLLDLICIAGFRGCGKTTIVSVAFPLWTILGVQGSKFVLIICQTQSKARNAMANIKTALENNRLLKSDMGPFREESGGEWALSSLVFRNTGARIMVASVDQSVRGIRHREHRPDVIILDDVEDSSSVRTYEGRKKIADWYSREIVPLGDIGTRIFVLANVLHEESLIMSLKTKIDGKQMDGVYRFYPLVDDRGRRLWPDKFRRHEDIEALRRRIGDEIAWQQEYMLRIISDASRPIDPKWIHYHDGSVLTEKFARSRLFAAVDLAISEKDSGDYTAIVQALVRHEDKGVRIYILPNPINERLSSPDAIDCMKVVIPTLGVNGLLFMETTGFQEAYLQHLLKDGYTNVVGVKPLKDKRMRLAMTGTPVRDGVVQFPKSGCKGLLAQITNFGIERYDDQADAFSMLIQQILEMYSYDTDPGLPKGPRQPGFFRPGHPW